MVARVRLPTQSSPVGSNSFDHSNGTQPNQETYPNTPATFSNFFTKIPSSPQQLAAHSFASFKASALIFSQAGEGNIINIS